MRFLTLSLFLSLLLSACPSEVVSTDDDDATADDDDSGDDDDATADDDDSGDDDDATADDDDSGDDDDVVDPDVFTLTHVDDAKPFGQGVSVLPGDEVYFIFYEGCRTNGEPIGSLDLTFSFLSSDEPAFGYVLGDDDPPLVRDHVLTCKLHQWNFTNAESQIHEGVSPNNEELAYEGVVPTTQEGGCFFLTPICQMGNNPNGNRDGFALTLLPESVQAYDPDGAPLSVEFDPNGTETDGTYWPVSHRCLLPNGGDNSTPCP